MKITILGCGWAGGVPLIGNNWGNCDSSEPRNRRLRVSILVEEGGQTLLVDTSPDMREQLLSCNLQDITAILFTHAHADHAHGIDNIRAVNWLTGRSVPLYGSAETMDELRRRFEYIFEDRPESVKYYRPSVETHVFEDRSALTFGPVHVQTFPQPHGKVICTGFRFNDFAYTTDVAQMSEEAFVALRGVKVWVLGAIREKPHHTHAHVDLAVQWIQRIKPERAYLTHMDHTLDYATLKAKLPDGIEPAYDGLVIEC